MERAERVRVGGIEISYEALGDPAHPPVLLVMGLGGQLHYWPDGLCQELTSRGLFVVRFDNRDVGLSSHMSSSPPVDLSGAGELPYTLSDMAGDVAGLIGALGLPSAHLVGISLGGMIVQLTAVEHPERVRSLVSIASTTGDPAVGQSRPDALQVLFTPPREATAEAVREQALLIGRAIGSPGFQLDEGWLQDRAEAAFHRAYDPAGVLRQAAAGARAEDRTARLRELRIPALVLHGDSDPLVDLSGARATAAAIPDAELVVIEGMGHDLPPGAWSRIAEAIERTVRRAEDSRGGARPGG